MQQSTINDVQSALTKMGIRVRFNKIRGQIEVHGIESSSEAYRFESLLVILRDELPFRKKELKACVEAVAESYNPVVDFIKNTTWDGQDRVSILLQEIMGLRDNFQKRLVTKWLHQCVALAFNEEDDRETVGAAGILVLVGKEAVGKTLLTQKLAVTGRLHIGGRLLKPYDKDNVSINTSSWITELCYVDKLTKAEKAFITAAKDGTNKPRRTSFCATDNEVPQPKSELLWVVGADGFNTERIVELKAAWVKQLWAQVYRQLYLPSPEGFRLTDEEKKELLAR